MTPGNWRKSEKHPDAIISDHCEHDSITELTYYGGTVICESTRSCDRPVLAEAKNMYLLIKEMVAKMQEIESNVQYQGVWTLAYDHKYTGPTWEKELDALKQIIRRIENENI